MFVIGGTPALLVGWIRHSVRESARWTSRTESARPAMSAAFVELFSPAYRRRTLVNAALVLVSIVGLWAGSYYVPLSVTQIALREGHAAAEAARYASYGTMVLAAGTILGCLVLPPLANRYGRRPMLALYFGLMFFSVSVGFGYIFYLQANALAWFFAVLFVLGVGGANFAMYTLWLPEQYATSCRASAFAFATSAGRFLGAGITFLVGAGISRFGTVGIPVAMTSVAFLLGIALLPLAEETRGRALPD
jgi:MFS family permease